MNCIRFATYLYQCLAGRELEKAKEILVRFPYNKIQSRIEKAKRRGEQQEMIKDMLA